MANDLCNLYKTPLSTVIRQAILRLWQNEQPLLKSLNKKNGQSEEIT